MGEMGEMSADGDFTGGGRGGNMMNMGDMDLSAAFTATEETMTITVSDQSILDGVTLGNLTEGTILGITYDAEGNMTKITALYVPGTQMQADAEEDAALATDAEE